MQYTNITVSDLNRADFISQRELSPQELNIAGGWGGYFRGGFALNKGSFGINTSGIKATSLKGDFALTGFTSKGIGFGFFKTSFSPKSVSGTSVVKIAVK